MESSRKDRESIRGQKSKFAPGSKRSTASSQKGILDLPMERRALMAFRSAVRKAIAERRRLGLPVYVLSRGKVVDISGRRRSRVSVSGNHRQSR